MSMAVVPISAVGPVAAATMLFRDNGTVHVAAIVKATFVFAHHHAMTLTQPEPIFTKELHRMNNPTRSIVATSDLVPRLPAVDVLMTGHAHAPGGGSAQHMVVRLSVGRGENVVLEKSIFVVGDRKGSEIKPFRSIPLAYEKAYGGPGYRDNPLGTGVLSGDAMPNLVHPDAPDSVAGFGPISKSWPSRSSLVAPEARTLLERPIAEITPGFDFRYFHAAPWDQRITHLIGDEWIVIEGVHPERPQIHLMLPSAQAQTKILTNDGDERVFSLRADTLRIDADNERCTVIWRNSFPVRDGAIESIRLMAGVALPNMPIVWPTYLEPLRTKGGAEGFMGGQGAQGASGKELGMEGAGGTMVLADGPTLSGSADSPSPSFGGTMEVADEDLESVHDVRPYLAQSPPPKPPKRDSDFGATAVLSNEDKPVPPAGAPAFLHAQNPRPLGGGRPLGGPRRGDFNAGTMDLTHDPSVLARQVMPFAKTEGQDNPVPVSASGPIPGSPWDPNREPSDEMSISEGDSLDLAGTLIPLATSTTQELAPLETALLDAQLVSYPAQIDAAPLFDPPQTSMPADEAPSATSAAPQDDAPAKDPSFDPWGQSLRENNLGEHADKESVSNALPAPSSKPTDQSPSVRNTLYKRFKKG